MSVDSENDHPRRRFTLDRVEAQSAAFEDALRRGRLHHAWLLIGPEGLGKAGFAFRAARRLLGARPNSAFGPMGASPDDPVSRMIAAQSHPDLMVLERAGEGARKVIPVDEARRLPEFFGKAPALGPYRVAIIDAVDDFNANGANAVLKTLEEPSARGVLFLISHAPGRLLPTIRSRCRTLAFRPWTSQAVNSFIVARSAMGAEEAARIAHMARGSPGRAAAMLQTQPVELDRLAVDIVAGIAPARASLMSLADGFRGGEGAERFALFLDRLASAVQQRASTAEAPDATHWAALWDRLSGVAGRVEGLNLDRADAFWSMLNDVAATARAPC